MIDEKIYKKAADKVYKIINDAHQSGKLIESDMLALHPGYKGDFWARIKNNLNEKKRT